MGSNDQPSPTKHVPVAVRRAQQDLAGHLSAWRKLRGLTQQQLAERANVNRKTIMRAEQGDGGVSIETLLRMLRGLGLLDVLPQALDPYESDLGRARADQQLPERVRTRHLRRPSPDG